MRKRKDVRKVLKHVLVLAVIFQFILVSFQFNSGISAEEGVVADRSNQVVVDDWKILDDSNVPLSENNIALPYQSYQLWFRWNLILTGEDKVQEGDSFSLDLPRNESNGVWRMTNSDYEFFYSTNDLVNPLGKWRVNNEKVEVSFLAGAEGQNNISVEFLTGKKVLKNTTLVGITQNVIFGKFSKEIAFKKYAPNVLGRGDYSYASNSSNASIYWGTTINNTGVVDLTQPALGTNFEEHKNVYYETTLEGTLSGNIGIYSGMSHPVDLDSGLASNANKITRINPYFKKVNQSTGEDYITFKQRLMPREFGVYLDAVTGKETIVIYFGDIGNNGITYDSIDPNFAQTMADHAIINHSFDSSLRDELISYYQTVYGSENAIQGNVARYTVFFTEVFEKVLENTEKSMSATITKNDISSVLTGTGTLQGMIGTGSVDNNTTRLFLSDEETGKLLPNAKFTLQMQNNDLSWSDAISFGELITNENGYVDIETLGLGTYRFIQTATSNLDYDLSKSQGFDLLLDTCISDEFIVVSANDEGKIIRMTNKKFRFDVQYLPGEHGVFETDLHESILIHSPTPHYLGEVNPNGQPIGEDGYRFIGWNVEIQPTVEGHMTYVALWEKIETVSNNPPIIDDTPNIKDDNNIIESEHPSNSKKEEKASSNVNTGDRMELKIIQFGMISLSIIVMSTILLKKKIMKNKQ